MEIFFFIEFIILLMVLGTICILNEYNSVCGKIYNFIVAHYSWCIYKTLLQNPQLYTIEEFNSVIQENIDTPFYIVVFSDKSLALFKRDHFDDGNACIIADNCGGKFLLDDLVSLKCSILKQRMKNKQ